MIDVNAWFPQHGFVPSERFMAEYEERLPRSRSFSVRSSVLKHAGEDGPNVVTAAASSVLKNVSASEIRVKRFL